MIETDSIVNISETQIGQTGIFVIMFVKVFRTDIIIFISDIIMCFMSG